MIVQANFQRKELGSGLYFLYLLNIQGFTFNYKRVYRVYIGSQAKNLRIKPKKRIKRFLFERLRIPRSSNQRRFMDFMYDQLADERSFCLLTLINEFNRERLGIEKDFSLLAECVIRSLN